MRTRIGLWRLYPLAMAGLLLGAVALSLVLVAVSLAVLVVLRNRWWGAR